jgi:hypothetical protein
MDTILENGLEKFVYLKIFLFMIYFSKDFDTTTSREFGRLEYDKD